MDAFRIERLTDAALRARLPELAALRIAVFREYPYLYDGSTEYEERYLEVYAATPGAVVVGAFAGDRLVGASTGLPLAAEPPGLKRPVADAGLPAERVFYFGESVLERAHRGRGIGVAFFEEREAHARALGGFEHAAFCAVVRPDDHPARPEGYVPLDAFWRRRGFAPLEGAVGSLAWKELGQAEETAKPMRFWHKRL